MSDVEFFAAHRDRSEYVRPPQPGEFGDLNPGPETHVRVYYINRRTLVKALESSSGERLATLIETVTPAEAREAA